MPILPGVSSFFDSAFRAFRRYRRWVAAVLTVIAVAAGLSTLSSAAADGRPTVVAARPIPSGTVISEADLTLVRLPASAVPEEAFSHPDQVVGRQALSEIAVRTVIGEPELLSDELTGTTGMLKLPVHFSDSAAVSLLRSGQHIDIFGPTGSAGGFALVATNIAVLAIPQPDQGGAWSGDGAALVVVEVNPEQAAAISAASSSTSLSFALR